MLFEVDNDHIVAILADFFLSKGFIETYSSIRSELCFYEQSLSPELSLLQQLVLQGR